MASPRQPRRSPPKKKPARVNSAPIGHEQFSLEQVTQALKQTRGMISAAAQLLHCHRQTLYDYQKRHPEVALALTEARELQLDTAELSLFRAIDKGESWAVCFYLKTRGRDRGYIERVDVGADASTLEQLVLQAHARRAERLAKAKPGLQVFKGAPGV